MDALMRDDGGWSLVRLEGFFDTLLIQEHVHMSHEYRFFIVDGVPVTGAAAITEFTPLDNTGPAFDPRFRSDRRTAEPPFRDEHMLARLATSPDQGEIRGRDAIGSYLSQMAEAFPDARYEPLEQHEAGNIAIDEGYFTGTNTGQIQMPQGESLPPTGREFRLRTCDVARLESGLIISHHFYWDHLEFMGQMGLLPESKTGAP